jgi:hypothetical protein
VVVRGGWGGFRVALAPASPTSAARMHSQSSFGEVISSADGGQGSTGVTCRRDVRGDGRCTSPLRRPVEFRRQRTAQRPLYDLPSAQLGILKSFIEVFEECDSSVVPILSHNFLLAASSSEARAPPFSCQENATAEISTRSGHRLEFSDAIREVGLTRVIRQRKRARSPARQGLGTG